jgi:hypothetical protein
MRQRIGFLWVLSFLPAGALEAEHVKGTEVLARTTKVVGAIDWGNDLEAVKEKAKKEKKLVFWLQLVGELDGGL